MAKCTMHLIIVSLLLLIVTVITAFRLRDLSPQVLRDLGTRPGQIIKSSDTNPPYGHCETCQSHSLVDRDSEGVNNVVINRIRRKHVTNKITYSELKLTVKEKQNLINLKKGKNNAYIGSDAAREQFLPEKRDFDVIGNEHKVNKKQPREISKEEHNLEDTDSSINVNYHDKKVAAPSTKHEYVKDNTLENNKDEVSRRSSRQQNIELSKRPVLSEINSNPFRRTMCEPISEVDLSKDDIPHKKAASKKPTEKISAVPKHQNSNKVKQSKDEYSSNETDDYESKDVGKSVRDSERTHLTPKDINIVERQTMDKTTTKTEKKEKTKQKNNTSETISETYKAIPAASIEKVPKIYPTGNYKTDKAMEHKKSDVSESHKKKVQAEYQKKKSKNDKKKDDKTSRYTHGTETEGEKRQERVRKQKADDALYRKNLHQNEFEDFYSFFPTFAPNYSRIQNPECRRHGQIHLRQLRGTKLWALQMLDSSAKIPSGLLRGNGNQLGDFDQCLASQARVRLDSGAVVRIRGKYCLAHVDVQAVHAELNLPVHLALGRNMVRSSNTDPGHFVPRFSSLSWGICLPAACGASEAASALRDALRHYNGTSGLRTHVHVDDHDCRQLTDRVWWSRWIDDVPTPLCLLFFSSFLLMVTYATVKDFIQRLNFDENIEMTAENDILGGRNCNMRTPNITDEEDGADEPVPIAPKVQGSNEGQKKSSFSLYETSRKMFKQGTEEGEIACIHGVRAVCSVALLMAHKLIPLAMTPFTNRIYLTELSNSPLSILLRASLIYTDSFLLLSGVLTAYHMSQDLNTTGSIPWLRRYIARYIRLTPALFAVVVWYAWVSDKVGDGPQWGSLVVTNADLCRNNFWKNILYIHNFFPFEEMCAPHTHQLALDMQLTLLAPLIVWLLHARPRAAFAALAALHALSLYLRYSTTIEHNLSLVIYHGITLGQLYRTANLSYSIALHRATPYVAGVSLGVLLRQLGKNNTHITRMILYPGWLACMSLGCWTLHAAAHTAARDYRYDVADAALYAALASLAWALALSWIIFACFTGNAGFLNTVLCAQPLLIVSRISYAMYLCQFLVFFYNVGSMRTSVEFNIFSFIDVIECTKILALSIVITAVFIIPMQSLQKHIMSYDFGSQGRISNEMANEKKNIEKEAEETSLEEHREENVEYIVGDLEVEPEEQLDDFELEYDEHKILEEIMEEEEEEYEEETPIGNSMWEQRQADSEADYRRPEDDSDPPWNMPEDDSEQDSDTHVASLNDLKN